MYRDKYVYQNDVIIHEINSEGLHHLIVNGELGRQVSYEEIAINQDYLALTEALSPTDETMVLHLKFGKLQAV